MRQLLACFFTLLASLAWVLPAHAARMALVIGNDQYRNVNTLKNAVNDAQLMAATLRAAGFEVVGGVRTNLDRNGLWGALEQFKGRLRKEDEVVFFYAGHGVQVEASQLLLPVDISNQSEDQVARDAVPLHRVQESLRDARFALLVIDACRDNPFPPKPGMRSIGQTRGLQPPAKAVEGSVVVMAAANGERALDNVPGGTAANGLFTHELVKALKTPGLDVLGAVRKTRARVVEQARTVNHAQKPTYVDEMAEGEFVLFPAVQVASIRPEPVPQAAGPSAVQIESQAWAAAQRANSLAGYNAYLGEYPSGSYASAARVARAGLEPAPRAAVPPVAAAEPAQTVRPAVPATLAAGQVFKDCAACPELVVIPAGSFQMGSNDGDADEKPVHSVSMKSFALGKTEVMQGQWQAVMGSNPSKFKDCGANCPVEQVSWDDIQQYIQKLNALSGQRYRLPSEAEWEYAARAGSTGKWSFGNDEAQLKQHGWYSANSDSKTHPAGQKQANAFGLYDMHGNVWEWTQDCGNESYSRAPSDGSAWATGDCGLRVLRGGSWDSSPSYARAANRDRGYTAGRNDYLGFRLARMLP